MNLNACQSYLREIYRQTTIKKREKNTMAETYGEILAPSLSKLMSLIPITPTDSFVDFGSGLGKIVTQVFLETTVCAAIGIEIVKDLHQQAILVREQIQKDFPGKFTNRHLQFIHANFLQTIILETTFTIINATCFDQALLCKLGVLLNQLPKLHTVFSLRPIPTLQTLQFKKAFSVQCSWDMTLCYWYTR